MKVIPASLVTRNSSVCQDSKSKMTIKVVEAPLVPTLDEPLTANDLLLLKTREWLIQPKSWAQDLVFDMLRGE